MGFSFARLREPGEMSGSFGDFSCRKELMSFMADRWGAPDCGRDILVGMAYRAVRCGGQDGWSLQDCDSGVFAWQETPRGGSRENFSVVMRSRLLFHAQTKYAQSLLRFGCVVRLGRGHSGRTVR